MIENQFTAPWQEKELKDLEQIFPHLFPEEVELFFPNRTAKAVREKAKTIHLKRSNRIVYRPKIFNNDADGNYVSGLTDGEGSFMSTIMAQRQKTDTNKRYCNFNPKFQIGLRSDDRPIIEWLKNYFDCGIISTIERNRFSTPNAKPITYFLVSNLYDLLSKIIPHFDTYSLRAKKKNDYKIWREMVHTQAEFYRKDWPDQIRDTMRSLYTRLVSERKWKENPSYCIEIGK
jgi:hypothetical protein